MTDGSTLEEPTEPSLLETPTDARATIGVVVRGVGTPHYEVEGTLIRGYINPLAFIEVDEPWISASPPEAVTDNHLRHMLCEPDTDSSLDAIVARYREISIEGSDRIFVAPLGFLEKIVWPLRHAKMSYALGNSMGTIALSGMVCEMASLLIFEAHTEHTGFTSKKKAPPSKHRELYEPGAFEKQRTTDRIRALHQLGLIDKDTNDRLISVGRIRNRYLHLLSQSLDDVKADAVDAFIDTVRVVIATLGLTISTNAPGQFVLKPDILELALKRQSELDQKSNQDAD